MLKFNHFQVRYPFLLPQEVDKMSITSKQKIKCIVWILFSIYVFMSKVLYIQYMSLAQQLPILVYYSFRGLLQPIRNLFCYLQIPFIEIHLDELPQQFSKLPRQILDRFRKIKVDKSQLPGLIYNDLYIEGQLPIMTYICKIFNREKILGEDIRIRAKLQQILDIYFQKWPESMNVLFSIAEHSANHTIQQLNAFTKQSYEQLMDKSKYIKQICQILDTYQGQSFIFGKITLIDFFFLQTCFYMRGLIGKKERVYYQRLSQWDPQNTHFLNKPNVYYFRMLEKFQRMMTNMQFYRNNIEYLQSFSILSAYISQQKANGLRKCWAGNLKFVK